MQLAYYRKSTFNLNETLDNLKNVIAATDWKLINETPIMNGKGFIVNVCHKQWVDNVLSADSNMIGFLPCSIALIEKSGEVVVGSGLPSILAGISQNPKIQQLAETAELELRKIINEAAGVGELKVSSVKLYSTKTCPYCIREKDWLVSNEIDHEVIYLEENQFAAERIVRETGQMGVPVTEIVYDDADSEYVIGFDTAQLSQILLK